MSQHWHGHWTNEAFRPVRLKNWEVPNWHPCWPQQHCKTTQFMADNQGRILVGKKKCTESPWGYFKGTWELPTKISRQDAYELSAPPEHKINAWDQHKKADKRGCAGRKTLTGKEKIRLQPTIRTPTGTPLLDNAIETDVSQQVKSELPTSALCVTDTKPTTRCTIHDTCQI